MVSLVGAAASAGFGFLLVLLVARLLGVHDSGVLLQTIAVFMIAVAVVRLGLDTVAMWLLPRLRVRDPAAVPAALTAILLPSLVAPCVVVVAWLALVAVRQDPVLGAEVDTAVSAAAPFLPFASLMMVAVAGTRAFGSVVPFNVIQNIAVPASRVVVIPAVVLAGGAAVASGVAWAAVFVPAAVISVVILLRRAQGGPPLLARPDRHLLRLVAGFGLPRTVSAAAEQANLWLAVILVGVLLDAGAAGAYGSAARFVAAGLIVSTAFRVTVAPRFSSLLAAGETTAVGHLYAVTARWVLLFGAPIYVALAVNATTVLRWLGDGFDEAATAMVILCLGSTLMLAAGNVQSLLLMSGGSGWAAVNRLIALGSMVVAVLLLVPQFGVTGAAVAWTIGTCLDVALAAIQVHRRTGISLDLLPVLAVAAVVVLSVGGPCLLAVVLLGQNWAGLLVGVAAAACCLALACWIGRRPLHIGELTAVFRRST
jgi:O-antigen/teichoic acid export membrane protein